MTTEDSTVSVASLNLIPMDSALGARISVIGGGGKSTLAKAIAVKTGIAYIEMDAIHWKPDWQESTAEELKDGVDKAIVAASGGWVIDGQYWSKIGDHVLKQADMVVWLNLPWLVMFWRMLRRSFQRAWDKNPVCGENVESWRQMCSTDALWLYWVRHPRRKGILGKRLAELLPAGTPVIRLTSAKELDRFYEIHSLTRQQ